MSWSAILGGWSLDSVMSQLERLHGVRTPSSLSEAQRLLAEAWSSPQLLRDQSGPSPELSQTVEDIEMSQAIEYPVLLDTLLAGVRQDLADIPEDAEFLGYGPEAPSQEPEPDGTRTPPHLRGPQDPLDNGQIMYQDCPPVGTLVGMLVGAAGHVEPIRSIDPKLLLKESWNMNANNYGHNYDFEVAEWFAVSISISPFYPDSDLFFHFLAALLERLPLGRLYLRSRRVRHAQQNNAALGKKDYQ